METQAATTSGSELWFSDTGATQLYWAVVPLGLTITSLLWSITAQKFAERYWDPITTNTKLVSINNKPTHTAWLSWVVNHTGSAIICSLCMVHAHYHGRLYEEDITQMGPADLILYLAKVVAWTIAMTALYDLQSYILHRYSHVNRTLYKLIHEFHHEHCLPNGYIAGIYGDAFEGTLIAFFATWQFAVLPCPISAALMFVGGIAFFVQLNHSGRKVEIPWLMYSARFHFYHHQRFRVNFAEHLYLWDWVFSTLCLDEGYHFSRGVSVASQKDSTNGEMKSSTTEKTDLILLRDY